VHVDEEILEDEDTEEHKLIDEILVLEMLDSLVGCDLGNICAKAER
jgi:hypothetical protein